MPRSATTTCEIIAKLKHKPTHHWLEQARVEAGEVVRECRGVAGEAGVQVPQGHRGAVGRAHAGALVGVCSGSGGSAGEPLHTGWRG
jgi:hypothetical protein